VRKTLEKSLINRLVIKAPLPTARAPLRIGSVHLFVCLSVCLSPTKNVIFSKKTCNLELWFLLTTYRKSQGHGSFSKNPLLDSKNLRWRRSAILKIVKSPYLNEKSSDFMKFRTQLQISNSMTTRWPNMNILPRDAYAHRGLCRRKMSVRLCVCPSVCPSHAGILSKQLYIYTVFQNKFTPRTFMITVWNENQFK